LQWLLKARVLRAQDQLETSSANIGEIGIALGFESTVTFRARFGQIYFGWQKWIEICLANHSLWQAKARMLAMLFKN
jgi:hypothetical protein